MKHTILASLLCFAACATFAQAVKQIPPSNLAPGQAVNLNIRPWHTASLPAADNPFGVAAPNVTPFPIIPGLKVVLGDEGLPISFESAAATAEAAPVDERTAAAGALAYVESLRPPGIQNPAAEFVVTKVQTDERNGNFHVRLEQRFQGVPVFGAELVAHTKNGVFTSAAGRYVPTPAIQRVQPQITAETAVQQTIAHLGADHVKKEWSATDLELIGGQQFRSELVIYRVKSENNAPHLAWKIEAYPSLISKLLYFVDAETGAILHSFPVSCSFAGNHHGNDAGCREVPSETQVELPGAESPDFAFTPPPVTGTGIDLAGIDRSFGAWLHSNGQYYLVNTTKPMFVSAGSNIPNGTMKGVIVTRDQQNVLDGPVAHITANTSTFNNPNAVSAHYNAALCYDYYLNTFDRNGIDGNGGSINVVVNVVEDDGNGDAQAMDNAYWNGNAMYWGNGNTFFTPLAKSLDITGHEMTHGVVQETAGLIYQDESGALNESFADIFGVMIDRDDWGIAEGVVLPGQTPTGLDRDFVDPHNGASEGESGWQPSHYLERYVGTWDNGGVHANSGITNHAFYLFATDPLVGKEIAEQVYYYVLRDRLTASSKFIDLRLAVIAEATEYYNTDIANVAAAAFDAVGVTNGPGSTAAAPLNPGTGKDYIISVSTDEQYMHLSTHDGNLLTTLYEDGVLDRPSVTDNGELLVFVNNAHQIAGIEIAYNDGSIQYNTGIISEDTTWRNAAISKDGRFLAGLTTLNDNKVIIFDLADPTGPTPREYFLVNPTYVQGIPWLDNVQYADVIEFDYSGTHLIYDAYSLVENADGEDVSYWDIGLLHFWEGGQYTPNDTPSIRKLITGLPEHASVGNPAFSKNSPGIIAFDYYEDLPAGGTEYLTYAANIETGDNGPVVSNGLELGYPCFTTHDDKILFQDKSLIGGTNLRIQPLAPGTINPQGNPGNIILGDKWGTWLNNSSRVLSVGTHQTRPASQLACSVAPNPANGFTRVTLSVPDAVRAQLEVTNLLGQSLQYRTLDLPAGENQFDLDLQAWPVGTYLVRILAGEKQGVLKLVKE